MSDNPVGFSVFLELIILIFEGLNDCESMEKLPRQRQVSQNQTYH